MTDEERKLWRYLRERLPMEGTHFRRQVPIGQYVADFCCLKHRLIIEVDGAQHGFDEQHRRDMRRTEFLEVQGFHVLRFWNHEINRGMDIVIDTIFAHLTGATPTP